MFIALTPGLLGGCISLYKADVQQGNMVTAEMLENLKLGMTPRQVRFLLGTPLIRDPFHPSRWDYPYTLELAGKLKERRHVAVFFKNDAVVAVTGDDVPAHLAPAPAAQP
ncbi:MAG TPA: outer membrane protein assembly factor BamE [Acidiferrobacterales bacterium]|jgi:outer membrane protein assembly factor BamE